MKSSKLILVKCGNVQVRIYRRQRKKGGQVYFQHDVADYTTGHRKFISFASEKQARAKAGEIAQVLGQVPGAADVQVAAPPGTPRPSIRIWVFVAPVFAPK